jgi:hypothetical protein
MNNKGKNYNGAVFRLNKKPINFDEQKAQEQKKRLLTKQMDIDVPGADPTRREIFQKNVFSSKKKPTVDNKWLQETLITNPYYMQRAELLEFEEQQLAEQQQQTQSSPNNNSNNQHFSERESSLELSTRHMNKDSSKDFF